MSTATTADTSPLPTFTLSARAYRIRELHEGITDTLRAAVRRSLDRVKEAGEHLLAAKAELKHGEFQAWIAEKCQPLSYRSAAVYMQITSNWDQLDRTCKALHISDLGIEKAAKLIADHRKEQRKEQLVKAAKLAERAEAGDEGSPMARAAFEKLPPEVQEIANVEVILNRPKRMHPDLARWLPKLSDYQARLLLNRLVTECYPAGGLALVWLAKGEIGDFEGA